MTEYNHELWQQVLELGEKEVSDGSANLLYSSHIATIVTMFRNFGASNNFLTGTINDLHVMKYRVFDWLCMSLQGRGFGDLDELVKPKMKWLIEQMSHAYLEADTDLNQWIHNINKQDFLKEYESL